MKFSGLISLLVFCIVLYSCRKTENSVLETPSEITWQKNGLDSCMVYALEFTANETFLAGTNYGLYRSVDNGNNWNYINQDIFETAVISFFANDNLILAGTSSKGIFKSFDDGVTWEYIGLKNIVITSIVVSEENKILVGTRGNGIYISTVNNVEWNIIKSEFNNQTFSALQVTSNDNIFAGGTGIYRSDDNGKTWKLKNNGLGNWS